MAAQCPHRWLCCVCYGSLYDPATVQVIDDYSGQSFRLLALARGVVRGQDRGALACMSQEQLEQLLEGFEMLGLLVLSNHLRPDSKDTITHLHHQ